MSRTTSKKLNINIIGAGCAGLSLAKYIKKAKDPKNLFDLKFYGELSPALENSHFWAFWGMPWSEEAISESEHKWNKWKIIDNNNEITLQSSLHPYYVLDSRFWLRYCGGEKYKMNPKFPANEELLFDSRNPISPKKKLIQEFVGQIIITKEETFYPDAAILMDYRCDQSKGIHFIYLLPFSKNMALVESTRISESSCPSKWYRDAIKEYLEKVCFVKKYSIEKEERGVIPMVNCTPLDKNILAIGSNGGCLRASSGYAFNSIQRQTKKLANDLLRGKNITKQRQILQPHSNIEKILDQVFLRVLMENPRRAPGLFIKIGQSMTGDEFALFMSGKAKLSIIVKMIISLPKRLFIKAMFTEIRSAFGYDKLSRNN
jgi:lycopene beta-cyclase